MIENEMFSRLYAHQWMTLPREVRMKLREVFSIPQTSVVEVRMNTVLTDGVTNDDLLVLTKEVLQKYVGKEGTFAELFAIAVDKVMEVKKPITIDMSSIQVLPPAKPFDPKRYCQTCDSIRGRHHKGCPKYS